MSFVKLKHTYEYMPHTIIPKGKADSFAGKYGLGVRHNTIWTPEPEKEVLYKVIPERYWKDFQVTRMSINSLLLPHVDNDFITTINFYYEPGDYKTIFFKPKDGANSWKTEEDRHTDVSAGIMEATEINVEDLKSKVKEFVAEKQNMPTCEEITYVDAVYSFDDVYEIGSFVAQRNEAYMLDVRVPHNVEPLDGTKLRKAFALRTRHYDYGRVYDMLKETGNL
jgi:hypothetical protein